jgi:hypothetical protein
MEKSIVLKLYRFCVVLTLCVLLAGIAGAETLHLTDGQTVSGEIVSIDDKGIVLKQPDGSYGERTPWTKLSQESLKELQQNPKAAQFVEPFIEVSQADKMAKTEIQIKEVARLPRPTGHSLVAAMFTSGIGIFTLFLLYAGNIYAAYEISVFRAQPVGLVCGVAAVAPLVGPIIFLSMPKELKQKEQEWQPAPEEPVEAGIAAAIAAEQAAEASPAEAVPAQPAAPALPPTKTYMRGQYTFNRRFFETQMPGFFAMVRSEADKEMLLTVKSTRGTHVANRISRITGNELYLQVQTGHAFEDVIVPFVEIQEVQIKHKDA